MELPKYKEYSLDEVVYALSYGGSKYHVMRDKDDPEGLWGVLCSRSKESLEMTHQILKLVDLECRDAKVVKTTLGNLIVTPCPTKYTIWIMDGTYEDREIVNIAEL